MTTPLLRCQVTSVLGIYVRPQAVEVHTNAMGVFVIVGLLWESGGHCLKPLSWVLFAEQYALALEVGTQCEVVIYGS